MSIVRQGISDRVLRSESEWPDVQHCKLGRRDVLSRRLQLLQNRFGLSPLTALRERIAQERLIARTVPKPIDQGLVMLRRELMELLGLVRGGEPKER